MTNEVIDSLNTQPTDRRTNKLITQLTYRPNN